MNKDEYIKNICALTKEYKRDVSDLRKMIIEFLKERRQPTNAAEDAIKGLRKEIPDSVWLRY